MSNTNTTGPKSSEQARAWGIADAKHGGGMANTGGWNGSARETYETNFFAQKRKNEEKQS